MPLSDPIPLYLRDRQKLELNPRKQIVSVPSWTFQPKSRIFYHVASASKDLLMIHMLSLIDMLSLTTSRSRSFGNRISVPFISHHSQILNHNDVSICATAEFRFADEPVLVGAPVLSEQSAAWGVTQKINTASINRESVLPIMQIDDDVIGWKDAFNLDANIIRGALLIAI